MRINSLKQNLSNGQTINYKHVKDYSGIRNNPFILQNSLISFKSDVSDSGRFIFVDIPNIHCPCCGKKMVPRKVYDSVLTRNALEGRSADAVKTLSKFQNNMPRIEKKCFNLIKSYSRKYPDKTINEILLVLRKENLPKLTKKQLKVINAIDKIGEDLPEQSKNMLIEITSNAKRIIIEDRPDYVFKRKTFIKNINAFADMLNEPVAINIGNKLRKTASKLTNSENDIDSFIAKYSKRGSFEIGQRLIPFSTVEHIRPKAPVNKNTPHGKSINKNYIAECSFDNNARMSTPLSVWVEIRPEMTKNIKKYMKDVLTLVKNGEVEGYDDYPLQVAKTLKIESQGKINIERWIKKIRAKRYKFDLTDFVKNLLPRGIK